MSKFISKKNFYILIALFVGLLFAYITYQTPLAGDDWGYALNGMKENPLVMAFSFYQSWSGRFFSELWGFVVAPNKWLWNILNPLLFVGIFVAIYKLVHTKNHYILVPFFILACMLSVDDQLRMETYSWIMGTTYVVPLCFSLLYFVSIDKLFKTNLINNKDKVIFIINNLLLFVIGLMMENIAGAMVGGIVILIIYAYFNRRKIIPYLSLNLVVSSLAFIIMRSSPGSNFRLMRDSADWVALSLIEKITGAYPSFIYNTFINNNYLILFFSIVIILMLLNTKNTTYKLYRYFSIAVMIFGIITAFSFVVPSLSFMQRPDSLYSILFWPIYTLVVLVDIFIYMENSYQRNKALFFIIIGGACSLAMLLSPINGIRSSIYLVFFLMLSGALILENIKLNKYIGFALVLIMSVVIIDRTMEYLQKYRLVALAQQERLQIIEYYQANPQDEDVWIPRFPIYTVHGADIEPSDTYHLEVFKDYYQLPQKAENITFYFKEPN